MSSMTYKNYMKLFDIFAGQVWNIFHEMKGKYSIINVRCFQKMNLIFPMHKVEFTLNL